jgi:predicted CXXCH cytochrome family protein
MRAALSVSLLALAASLSAMFPAASAMFPPAFAPQPGAAPGDADPARNSCLECHEGGELLALKTNGRLGPDARREDPRELEELAVISAEADPGRKRDMAQKFLAAHPDSWMLDSAYETVSMASIALNDFPAALDYGTRSLRLLPENPPLLLALAEVQTKTGMLDAAIAGARDALGYLDRFYHPSSVDDAAWAQLKRRLQAQAWFAIGRAAATEGLSSEGAARTAKLADAENALRQVLTLDPASAGAAFLLGVTYQADRRLGEAVGFFALAAKGPPRTEALARLRAIYSADAVAATRPFEEWLAALKPALPQTAAARRPAVQKRAYAGTDACRECHTAEHASWQSTGMGRMFRPYRAEDVIGDFTSGASGGVAVNGAGEPTVRAVIRDGRHYLEIRNGGAWKSFRVDYLIGSKWQQAYATVLPGGAIQVFPLQYNLQHRMWVNYWEMKDPADSARADITRFQEDSHAIHQLECAACHTSQQHFSEGRFSVRTSSIRGGGINCEMCHGPSAAHVAAMRAGHAYSKGAAEPPVDFRQLSAPEYVNICATCHMQSGIRDPEASGAMNYSETGERFYRTFLSRPYSEYPARAFYKDGRFRETVFIVEALLRTKCFRLGAAQCGSCHDPHPAEPAANPTSLKFAANDSDRMCLQCHGEFEARLEQHTRHNPTSEASRCVSCHMPRIMNALLFRARTHQIDDIPDAAMTERFGRADSPNACLICHKDRDTAWLRTNLDAWKADNPRPR